MRTLMLGGYACAVGAAPIELQAIDKRDLYRFAVFRSRTPLATARSIAEIVGWSNFLAAAGSPERIALRIDLITDRTRVRFERFTAARLID